MTEGFCDIFRVKTVLPEIWMKWGKKIFKEIRINTNCFPYKWKVLIKMAQCIYGYAFIVSLLFPKQGGDITLIIWILWTTNGKILRWVMTFVSWYLSDSKGGKLQTNRPERAGSSNNFHFLLFSSFIDQWNHHWIVNFSAHCIYITYFY